MKPTEGGNSRTVYHRSEIWYKIGGSHTEQMVTAPGRNSLAVVARWHDKRDGVNMVKIRWRSRGFRNSGSTPSGIDCKFENSQMRCRSMLTDAHDGSHRHSTQEFRLVMPIVFTKYYVERFGQHIRDNGLRSTTVLVGKNLIWPYCEWLIRR